MDPIAHLVALQGETAVLKAPASTKPYHPSESADYVPNAPTSLTVRGVPETKIEAVVGAVGAFTFQATTRPPGLKALESKLVWRGDEWTVLKIRSRTWMGQINGFTLYLGT